MRHRCLALGTEAGTAPISVPVGRYGLVTGRSYLMRDTEGPDSNAEFDGQVPVMVSVDRLDAFCSREAIGRVDFVKIDVEGAELQVLQGGREVIEAHRPTMLIEIEARHTARYGHSPEDVSGWLLKRGYTMHTWRRGWREADSVGTGTRNYLFRASPFSRARVNQARCRATEGTGPAQQRRLAWLARPCSRGMPPSSPSSPRGRAVTWGTWAAAGLCPRRPRRPASRAGPRCRS